MANCAPDYDLGNLHSSLNWDAGLGLRAWAKGVAERVHAAWSEESGGLQTMAGQPSQF